MTPLLHYVRFPSRCVDLNGKAKHTLSSLPLFGLLRQLWKVTNLFPSKERNVNLTSLHNFEGREET